MTQLALILEALLMSSSTPLSIEAMQSAFVHTEIPSKDSILNALSSLQNSYQERAIELKKGAKGFRIQTKSIYAPWIIQLMQEKPSKYSRALLETLAIIAYRQPITRAEIENIRGVSLSGPLLKTLLEREWVKVSGYKELPGKPALYVTTAAFLDYFNLANLAELPALG